MKNEVEYDVNLDVLLMVSIYVIKSNQYLREYLKQTKHLADWLSGGQTGILQHCRQSAMILKSCNYAEMRTHMPDMV